MIESLLEEVEHRPAAPGFVLTGPVAHTGDAGVDDGPGAHGAGLQGDVQGAPGEPPGAHSGTGHVDGLHLSVGGGPAVRLPAVAAPADDVPLLGDDDAAHGHVSLGDAGFGLLQGLLHVFLVGHVKVLSGEKFLNLTKIN